MVLLHFSCKRGYTKHIYAYLIAILLILHNVCLNVQECQELDVTPDGYVEHHLIQP